MSASDSPYVIRGSFLVEVRAENGGTGVAVWVVGEHDAAGAKDLSDLLLAATKVTRGEVVVDLSKVTFASAASIGVIVGCRNALTREARGLSLRSPSCAAKRLLDLCEIPYVDVTKPTIDGAGRQSALHSWVPVPTLTRSEPADRSPTESTSADPVETHEHTNHEHTNHEHTNADEGSA